ncbi:MAG: hypothetical protein HY261_03150 [Chloroflexi bacterium]|nr:hypothetical protein [Chloroflexota bacterium]
MTKGEVFYDAAKAQVDEQDTRRQHFDTMASSVLGFAAILVGLTSFTVGRWLTLSTALFFLMLATFASVAFFVLQELWLRGWKQQPKIGDLEQHAKDAQYDDETIVTWTARQLGRAVKENECTLTEKAEALRFAYFALVFHVGATAAFIASVAAKA